MNVLVCTENHFVEVGTDVFSNQTSPEFFQRYLDAWEEVMVLGRVSCAESAPQGFHKVEMNGIRLVGLPDFYGPEQYLRNFRRCRAIARSAIADTGSIILRAPGTVSNLVCSLIRRSRRPFGLEVVGDPGSSMARGSTRHLLRPFFRWWYVSSLKRQCRAAYATSYVTEKAVQQLYPPAAGRFSTNYSSIDLDSSGLRDTPREGFPRGGRHHLILVGSLGAMYKGQDLLLRSLFGLVNDGWDLEATLVGGGKYQPAMEQLTAELGLQDRVHMVGELKAGNAVRAALDAADLFVMPSRTEGLPKAMIEAMARGLPCIGSRVGGIPELLEEEEMFRPDDSGNLAAKIAEVLGDPARMARLSRRNLEVARRYTADVLRSRRNEFYQCVRAGTEAWLVQRGAAARQPQLGEKT